MVAQSQDLVVVMVVIPMVPLAVFVLRVVAAGSKRKIELGTLNFPRGAVRDPLE
jgi:hypothetical protein